MTIEEKIERESPEMIRIYREGMFWKLYNRSAFHFFQLIRPYLVKKKYMKGLQAEIVSMGFPHSVLEDMLTRLEDVSVSLEKNEEEITVWLSEPQTGYEEWFGQYSCEEKEGLGMIND